MAPRTKNRKKNKRDKERELLEAYGDATKPGSLRGVSRFARIHRLKPAEAQKILEKDLAYTLHRPRRRGRFPTLPVLVFGKDEQWVADLMEMQPLAKYNSGNRYLLVVVDAFSKYAWVEPIISKTGIAVTEAFKKILKRAEGRTQQTLQTDDGKEFYNDTFQKLMKDKDIHHFFYDP